MTDRRRSWVWYKWTSLVLSVVLLGGWSSWVGWGTGYFVGGGGALFLADGAFTYFEGPAVATKGWMPLSHTTPHCLLWPEVALPLIAIPLWILLLPAIALTVVAWRRARVPVPRNPCAKCRYDLSGIPLASPCPECGAAAEGTIPASR